MRRSALVASMLLLAVPTAARGQPAGGLEERPKRPTNVNDFTAGTMAGPYDATLVRGNKTLRYRARLESATKDKATLVLGDARFPLTRVLGTPDFTGEKGTGSIVSALGNEPAGTLAVKLVIVQLNKLTGEILKAGQPYGTLTLWRASLASLSETEKQEFDAGPPPDVQAHFDSLAAYDEYKKHFWFDFGPVFYRGRVDGTAKVIGIASDPGPTECLPFVRRTLVGDAGQRVQGLLRKIGLTRSYALSNAHAYALFPSHATAPVTTADLAAIASRDPAFVASLKERYVEPQWGQVVMNDPKILAWRNDFYSKIAGNKLQAIVVFGNQSKDAVRLWIKGEAYKAVKDRFGGMTETRVATLPDGREIPIFYIQHPSAYDPNILLETWRRAVPKLRRFVTPDEDAPKPLEPNYGEEFTENDYARVPRRDLPEEAPDYIGDDSWGRAQRFPQNNSADRPQPDDRKTLIYESPAKTKIPERLLTIVGPNPENPNRTPVFATSQAVAIDVAAVTTQIPAEVNPGTRLNLAIRGTSVHAFDRVLIRTTPESRIIRIDAYVRIADGEPPAVEMPWTATVRTPKLSEPGTYSIVFNGALGQIQTIPVAVKAPAPVAVPVPANVPVPPNVPVPTPPN